MAKPNKIGEMAQEAGLSEVQFLQNLIIRHSSQKGIADALGVSQATVSDAMKRNGFVLKSEWVQDTPDVDTDDEPDTSAWAKEAGLIDENGEFTSFGHAYLDTESA